MAANAAPLLEQLRREALLGAAQTRAEADASCERIRAEAVGAAAAQRTSALAERERSAAQQLTTARSEAEQRTRGKTLAARADALDRIFARAALELETFASHEGLRELLARLLGEALGYLPDGPVVVRCARGLGENVSAALKAAGRADADVREDSSVPLGMLVETADGAIAVDVTLARLVARLRPRLSPALALQLDTRAP